ncbi:MAG: Methenyltetrahydromethanopterin cyclohydrolase [Candidatus Thorarchaeota archaeon]|nr:MAG: Methenyltetrahydromethanopterin cyclohydrolase [Candidatus Thorarchaeota archaeon]
MEESINQRAFMIVQKMMEDARKINCIVYEQKNGASIIDAGVNASGSDEAGRIIGEICMGGMGSVRLTTVHIEDLTLPAVVVSTDQPITATLGSQFAGWQIKVEDYFAMGSGPARALARVENLFEKIAYSDESDVAVIVLESKETPPESVTQYIAEKCRVDASDLYCIVSPTASLAGSVQISSRIVEVGVHKLFKLGVNPEKIKKGHGLAPIAPVAKSDGKAMGRTNDCVLYGGRTFFYIRGEDIELQDITEQAPSNTSSQYGKPFYKLFKSFDFDFYKIDPMLFSPAEITVYDIDSGEVYKAGELNPDILRESLGL